MHNALQNILKKYPCHALGDYSNALKEIIQQITLLGLWRAKFFEKSAFYGGTALRILYGLNRFSEDLDFSLLKPEPNFDLQYYNEAIIAEMNSFGFQVTIEPKEKVKVSAIQTAVIKANTKLQLMNISAPAEVIEPIHGEQRLKIKMEVDINPPLNFTAESKWVQEPILFSVNTFSLPDLFASKIHAILCRNWKTRVKGRDWFDLIWYVNQKVSLSILHLKSRLVQSEDWSIDERLQLTDVKRLLEQKINNLDIEQAREDVAPFIQDRDSLSLWSRDFFLHVIKNIVE
jgi:predicted nucleotidyltransferase component of viral defense system